MARGNAFGNFDSEYARILIRVKAKRMRGKAGIRPSDLEDVEQALWLHLLQQAAKFDASRGSVNTFIDRVVESGAKMLLRERKRLKRAPGFVIQSLEAVIECESGCPKPLSEFISSADVDRRTGAAGQSEADQRETAEAIAAVIDALPTALREVCQLIMAGQIKDAKAVLGNSRRRFAAAKAALQEILRSAGFDQR